LLGNGGATGVGFGGYSHQRADRRGGDRAGIRGAPETDQAQFFLGARGFLQKPLSPAVIARTVRDVLDG